MIIIKMANEKIKKKKKKIRIIDHLREWGNKKRPKTERKQNRIRSKKSTYNSKFERISGKKFAHTHREREGYYSIDNNNSGYDDDDDGYQE